MDELGFDSCGIMLMLVSCSVDQFPLIYYPLNDFLMFVQIWKEKKENILLWQS